MNSKKNMYKNDIILKIEMFDENKLKEIHNIVDIFFKEFVKPTQYKKLILRKKKLSDFIQMMDEKGSVWNQENHPGLKLTEDTIKYVDTIRQNWGKHE